MSLNLKFITNRSSVNFYKYFLKVNRLYINNVKHNNEIKFISQLFSDA